MKYLCAFLFCCTALLSLISQAQTHKPIILGEAYELKSAILSETRTLNIYLPPGYNSSDTQKYPVIYMLDGGMDEDFIHICGIVQFDNLSWVARVPESIVVGITNKDRKHDLTCPTTIGNDKKRFPTTGGSAQFIAFIEKEVQPFVAHTFRTTPQKTIIGQSLAGLLATEILLKKPYMFDKYIIISPSLWWDNGSLLRQQMNIAAIPGKLGVYIGVGKEGLAPCDTPHVMEVDANLLKDKLDNYHNKNLSVFLDYLPDETHATITHQAVFNAFRILYPYIR